jgi:hypothetical protein
MVLLIVPLWQRPTSSAPDEMLAAEPRVEATTIQTVGGKGYDGFAIALVA